MKVRRNKPTLREQADDVREAYRGFGEKKQRLYEEAVGSIEQTQHPLAAVVSVGVLLLAWCLAIFTKISVPFLWDQFRFTPVFALFFIAYFAFFLVSRLVIRPSIDELTDTTSYFALFSAYAPRADRGLYSAAFAVLHTIIFVVYLISKDVSWTDVF